MPHHGLFAALPIWGVFIITLLFVLLSVEGGYYWARKKRRSEVEKEAPVGAMVGAVLGLFAFIQTDRSASALVRVSSDTPRAFRFSISRAMGASSNRSRSARRPCPM